jgi:cyclopropane fatty-acyl-phospholipid synthase-like methyltransferase
MRNKTSDAFGHMLMDYYKTGKGKGEIIERNDGFISVGGFGPISYFSDYSKWSSLEKKAIKLVKGKILDIGCGAGRHSLYLQQKYFNVIGIDNSPLSIKVCKLRGMKKAVLSSIEDVDKLKEKEFETVLMFGNNFGLVNTPAKAKSILKKLYKITTTNARILAESTDPTTTNPDDLFYHNENKKRGRLPGQLIIRVRYRRFIGPWFQFLFLTKKELEAVVKDTGWKVEKYIDGDSDYVVVLEK